VIRTAKLEDIPRIVDLGEMMHQESNYRDVPFSREKVAALMTHLITRDGVVFLAERGGVVAGGIAAAVAEQWFSDEKFGFEYGLFITPESRHGITAGRLLRAYRIWCKSQGAKRASLGITTGVNVEGTARFYRSQGWQDFGPIFWMEV
jgi:GNAT superfamily N-acetyltransferase